MSLSKAIFFLSMEGVCSRLRRTNKHHVHLFLKTQYAVNQAIHSIREADSILTIDCRIPTSHFLTSITTFAVARPTCTQPVPPCPSCPGFAAHPRAHTLRLFGFPTIYISYRFFMQQDASYLYGQCENIDGEAEWCDKVCIMNEM